MDTLKIALQKSGRLNAESLKIIKDCGISIDNGNDQLRVTAVNFPLEIYFLRNADISQYVMDGIVDCAIIGENTLVEDKIPLDIVERLGFSKCRLSLAVPKKPDSYRRLADLRQKRIATSYPNTVLSFFKKNRVEVDIHQISGSVEIAPNIGLADAIVDIVSSGNTLYKNNLKEVAVILKSEAVLVANKILDPQKSTLLQKLQFRIQSVLRARESKYILMNVPDRQIKRVSEILPVLKSPTVMPLAQKGWKSVHSVIREETFWEVIEELKKAGAEDILIIPIEKIVA